MRIYVPTVIEGQSWVLPKALEDNLPLSELGSQRHYCWAPIPMELLTEDEEGNPRGRSDFPWYGPHLLVCSSKAANLLRNRLASYGEFLELAGPEGLELFNATIALDALDEGLSRIARFDDGAILSIELHMFRREAIGNELVFKLPHRGSSLYFQGEFVEQIGSLDLHGIAFELAWSDEPHPARQVVFACQQ
jgi:hypothetical protein